MRPQSSNLLLWDFRPRLELIRCFMMGNAGASMAFRRRRFSPDQCLHADFIIDSWLLVCLWSSLEWDLHRGICHTEIAVHAFPARRRFYAGVLQRTLAATPIDKLYTKISPPYKTYRLESSLIDQNSLQLLSNIWGRMYAYSGISVLISTSNVDVCRDSSLLILVINPITSANSKLNNDSNVEKY